MSIFCSIISLGRIAAVVVILATGLSGWSGFAVAESVADFYKGKRIRVIIGYGAGGGYDSYARFITRHMARFIPGNPRMVAQNMPGAGSTRAAQFLTVKAPRDGTILATLGQNLPLSQALYPKNAGFDALKLIWIGNVNEGNNIIIAWHTSGFKTIEDVKKRQMIVPATGVRSTSVMYPRALNNIIGTKFKIIIGFKGGRRLNLSMEQGETDGRGSTAWASLKAKTPHYLRDKQVHILLQMGLKKEKELPNVPLMLDLANNPAERKVFEILASGVRIGRPIVTTPGVPLDRVKALRAAFDAAVIDQKLLAEAKRMKLDINPVPGIEVQRVVTQVVNAPKDIVALTRAALSKGKVFKCKALVKDRKLCRSKKKKKK